MFIGMRKLILILIVWTTWCITDIYSQSEFKFVDEDKRAVTLKFKSINNLIILSALLNGEFVNFLVDTGVNKTKIFGKVKDSADLKGAEYISLRSLGSSEPVKAYKTINNTINFGPIIGKNQEVYFITDPRYDLASKLGINVQGIIGYDFLKEFIVRLNYNRTSLRFYQHHKFNRKLKRFDKIKFRFIRKKPHFKVPMKFQDGSLEELVFLLDTGSNDAFWVFENENIKAPDNSFEDYVGYGLELAVEGRRSKSISAEIGEFKIEEPRTAYIDSLSARLFTADQFKNGIVGSEILKRFVWFFDYKNQNMYFRPSSNFKENSNYDRSGLIMMYGGEEVNTIKTPILVRVNRDSNYSTTIDNKFEIRLEVTKILEVAQIRPNSPASKVDIKIGDRILKLNGKDISRMSFQDINDLLSSEEGKRIKIKLKRDKNTLDRELYLSSQLNEL